MKGVFIFNHKNDIVFVNTDKCFDQHVKTCAAKEGLIQAGNTEEELDPNIILQLYSPLVASQRFMTGQAKNPYDKIRTSNGFTVVLKQFSDYVFMSLNGDGEEKAEFMHRKLLVLNRIITFLHGPCIEEIRPDKHKERSMRWKLIGHFLQTWCDLYRKEQSILVEGVERLHVNRMLNSRSIELLESGVGRLRASGEKHATHAMLIVNSKLLSLYSVRNATVLSSSDQMMLILLANMLFGGEENSSPTFCSLSSRETKTRRTGAANTPVKIGASASQQANVTDQSAAQQGESSSDLEENQISSDQKITDSSDEEISGFSKVKSSPKGKNPYFPKLSDTQSQASLNFNKSPILDSTRVTPQHRNVTWNSQPDVITNSHSQSNQSTSMVTLPSHFIGQSKCTSDLLVPNVIVSTTNHLSADLNEDFNSNTLSSSGHVLRMLSDVPHPRSQGDLNLIETTDNNRSSDNQNKDTPHFASRTHSLPVITNSGNDVTTNVGEVLKNSLPVQSLKLNKSRSELSWNTQGSDEELNGYCNLTVMLRKGDVENVPHMVHCVRVMHGTYLMMVCERTKVQYAQVINQTASTIRAVMSSKPVMTKHTPKQIQDFVDANVKKLGELLKKSKGHTHIERLIVDIANKWELAKQENFLQHYRPDSSSHFPPKLESALSHLIEKLHALFRLLYLSKKIMDAEDLKRLLDGVKEIHWTVNRTLLDYKDYIAIKSQRNVAMTMYHNDFPGMIHFIFVNRSTNHVIASSFSEHAYEEESEHKMHIHVQKQVWCMYERMREKLAAGYTTMTVRENSFHFSYFLWFEDSQGGFSIVPQKPFTGLRASDNLLPGVLTFNFYSWLQKVMFPRLEKKTLQCYEMFVVHVGLVPTQFALSHCRKLAAKLWESSGESSTSVSLL